MRSLLEASSLSITGFTVPLTLALFTSNSLARNQSNASSSSSSDTSSATSVQSSSKETNSSSSLQIITTITQDVAGSSAGDIIATKPILSNSITFSSNLSHDSFTRTPVFQTYSSLSFLQSHFTESSHSTTLTLSTNNSLSRHRSNASSMSSRSTGITSPHSFPSRAKEANATSYLQVRTTMMQTISTVTGNLLGTIDAREPITSKSVTVASSLVHNSPTRTTLFVNNSSAYVHQSDSTKTVHSTGHEGSLNSNTSPGATSGSYSGFQSHTSNGSNLLTSRTDFASYISSTIPSLVATVHESKPSSLAPASNRTATRSLTPSITVSEPSQFISDHRVMTTAFSSSGTVVKNSPLGMSSRKTLQLNQTMHSTFENSRPSETRQSSESVLFSNQVSVTMTMEQISTFDTSKHTPNVSSVVTSYPNGVLPNTSVKDKGHISTALSSSIALETSTKQESLSQAESTVNNSYVSFSSSPGISNSIQPLPTSKTPLLSSVSLTYSNNSVSASVLMATKSLSASLTVLQETPGRSRITPDSSQPMKTTFHSGQVLSSLSFQSKEKTSISTQFTATATRQLPYVSVALSISSSIVNISSSKSTSNLTLASQTTAILPLPSSEYVNISTMGFSHISASTTLESTNVSTFMSTSFNVAATTIDSTTQLFVTPTSTRSGNSSATDKVTSSLKISGFETATSYISSFAGERNSSSLGDKGTATVSNLTPSVLSTNFSYLVSYTSNHMNESSVYSKGSPLQNQTVSFSQPYSREGSSASTLLQKPLTSLTLITSIIKTSFSAKKMTSEILPTLTLSTVPLATSISDSAASQLVSTNVSRAISYSRNTTETESSSAISSSVSIKTVSSFSVVYTASSRSDPNQTLASSTLQGVSLATFAETASRTTNHSVSVHERSSYLHEKSSKFKKPETNNFK